MKASTHKYLLKLLDTGKLSQSSISKSVLPVIEQFRDAGFVQWQRSGRGGIFTLKNRKAVEKLLEGTGYHGQIEDLSPKAKSVAFNKNAHGGRDNTLLFLLATTPDVLWYKNGEPLNIFEIVQKCGVASILVRPEDDWRTDHPIALVENKDLLVYATRYFKRIQFKGNIMYYGGWVSNRVIEWLKQQEKPPHIIFPDYDIVGLTNYLKLKAEFPDIKLYIPNNLSDLLKRFGNAEKLKTKASRRLIETTRDKDARRVYSLILKYGVGLDQESLML